MPHRSRARLSAARLLLSSAVAVAAVLATTAPASAQLVRKHDFTLFGQGYVNEEVVVSKHFDVLAGWVQDDWADVADRTDPFSPTIAAPSTITSVYSWARCDERGASCTAIEGEHHDWYFIRAEDQGHRIRGLQTATSRSGERATVTSNATHVVHEIVPVPSSTLIVQPASWIPGGGYWMYNGEWAGASTVYRQWMRCDAVGDNCVDIPGATRTEYSLVADDNGHRLRVRTWASSALGTSEIQTSARTTLIGSDYPDGVSYSSLLPLPRFPEPDPVETPEIVYEIPQTSTPAPSPAPSSPPAPTPTPAATAPASTGLATTLAPGSVRRTEGQLILDRLPVRLKRARATCPATATATITAPKTSRRVSVRVPVVADGAAGCTITATLALPSKLRAASRLTLTIAAPRLKTLTRSIRTP